MIGPGSDKNNRGDLGHIVGSLMPGTISTNSHTCSISHSHSLQCLSLTCSVSPLFCSATTIIGSQHLCVALWVVKRFVFCFFTFVCSSCSEFHFHLSAEHTILTILLRRLYRKKMFLIAFKSAYLWWSARNENLAACLWVQIVILKSDKCVEDRCVGFP